MYSKIKEWLYWATKVFINDCSLGLFLIAIGFLGGMCFIILCKYFQKLLTF